MSATLGFSGRQPTSATANRIPPGQHIVEEFPVLSAGPTQRVAENDWAFTLKIGPKPVKTWNWSAFNAPPQTKVTCDIHCGTTWTKLDVPWEGVLVDDILSDAGLRAADRLTAGLTRS